MPAVSSPRWARRFIAALLLVSAAATAQTPQTRAGTPVILISIDTLRADHLSCFGYKKLQTPNIDAWAQGGTLFTQISSQAPMTLPSHVSLFTSTYPFANGIRENAQTLPAGTATLATILEEHGYKTAAFIGGYFLERRFGLAQGFETYDSPFDNRPVKGALDLKRPAAQVIDSAERWLDKNSGHPFFLFVHLFDLHEPYDPPAAYRACAPQSEYDQELAYVDDQIDRFHDYLAKSGLDRRALVVIFSDHGESLGDHGENTHGYFVYQSTLHVPLIFHWPGSNEISNLKSGISESARARGPDAPMSSMQLMHSRVDAPAGLIDVAPTILDVLGISPPRAFSGHSLLDLAKGEGSPPRDIYSESSYAHDMFGWSKLHSLRSGNYQLIDAPKPEFYDLKTDPEELHNLLPGEAALTATYREKLAALVSEYSPPGPEGKKPAAPASTSAEDLRGLGYLDITAPRPALDDSGIDPKDRLFEYKRYLMAGHLARIGKAEEAVAEFDAILSEDPKNFPAYLDVAQSEIGLHRCLDAANHLKAAIALAPRNVQAEEMLGDVWITVGDSGRAEAEFERLLIFAPQDYEAHYSLGLVTRGHGKLADAERHFRAAIATKPDSAEAHYQLGMVLESQNRKQDAAREFETAIAADPQYKPARSELARLVRAEH
jgi:arylsulfatase A-like enzyme